MSSIILPSAFAEETTKQNWEYYLARPFSLFGGSLWNYWHSSDQIFEILETKLTDVLLVETHPNFVRKYGLGKQIKKYKEAIKNLTRDIEHTKNLLRIGLELNEEALTKLRNKQFLTFEEEIEFIVKVALHATVIPCFVYDLFIEGGGTDSELEKLCESLQAKSLYPRLMKNIIIPLAQKKLGELNIKDTSKNIELITLSELLSGKTDMLSKRRSKREKNFFFVYQNLDGKELVEWTKNPRDFIIQLERVGSRSSAISGTVAFTGKIKGHARLVLTNDYQSKKFNKGDILVASSTSPELIPIINKAGAIVTDEGGMMCHAAILSREFQKPCVVGTNTATLMINDGDLVEVDADSGVVKILQRNNRK